MSAVDASHESLENVEVLTSNPAIQKSSLPYIHDRSAQSLKAAMRSEFLSILSDRKEVRESMKANKELEEKRVMDQWLAVERKAKQKRLKEFLDRLSKNQKLLNQGKTQESIDQNIKEHIEKYRQNKKERVVHLKEKLSANENHEYINRRAEQIEKQIEQNVENYQRKTEKLKEVQDKRKMLLQRRIQLKREAREKRILRAKVKNIIDQALGKSCERYKQNAEHFEDEVYSRPVKSLDEAFFAKLDDNELKQVHNS
jgi:hypothetical protein